MVWAVQNMNDKLCQRDIDKQVKFWHDSAMDNLKTAESLLRSKRYNFSMFMCQQTIEALLKCAFVKLRCDRPPYLHKLPRLLFLSGLEVPSWADEIILSVDAHYIKARYFADRFNTSIYNKKNASDLLNQTKRVVKWLIKEMSLKK